MARFKLSLLTPYTETKKGAAKDFYNAIYLEDIITDFIPQLDSYNNSQKQANHNNETEPVKHLENSKYTTSFSYAEKVSFSQNAQKNLSFSMNRYIIRNNEYFENPFVNLLQDGSQILLTDQYGNEYFFTITNIKYTFKETNIIYDYTCQDSFSYQTSRQNQNYTIDNDATSVDFIGPKTADWWIVHKVVPECYLTNYLYIPCSRALYENTNGEYILCDNLAEKTDVKRVIKEPHTFDEQDYYQTFIYSCSGMNANSVLIDIADKIKMQLVSFEHAKYNNTERTKYFDRYFWLEPKNNDKRVGLTYSPKRDIQTFDLTHGGQSLTTVLNVQGPTYNDEIITLLPNIPLFFQNFFLREDWNKEDYSEGLFTKACSGETFISNLGFTDADLITGGNRFCIDEVDISSLPGFILICIYNKITNDNEKVFINHSNIYNYFTFKYEDKESEIDYTDRNPVISKPGGDSWFLAQKRRTGDDTYVYDLFYPGQINDKDIQSDLPTYIAIAATPEQTPIITFANIYLKFYRDATAEELEFAQIADTCPWLENKIIDFNYFKEQNIISRKEYNSLMDILNNDLRKVNGRLIYYTQAYYKALHDKTEIIANMTNQLDTLGAACQAAIIDPLATTGSIKDISYFENAYNTVFNIGTAGIENLLNYNEVVSDYFTKYFNAEQRFLKNIYNFKEYFNAVNPLKDKELYRYTINLPQPQGSWADIDEFYGFEGNKFISINNQSYPYVFYAGYGDSEDNVDVPDYGRTFLPIYLNQNGKLTEIAVASADKWENEELYRYPDFKGAEKFCANEKTRYNENKKYLELSFKLPIEYTNNYYHWNNRKISNKSTVNYTKQQYENITAQSSLYGLYRLSITLNTHTYSTITRLNSIVDEKVENVTLHYAMITLMHQGEWSVDGGSPTQLDILSLLGTISFENGAYIPLNTNVIITPVYYDNGYIDFNENYTVVSGYIGLIAATQASIQSNWIYTHYLQNTNQVYIEQKPWYIPTEDIMSPLNEMVKWATANLFFGVASGNAYKQLEEDEDNDYFNEEPTVFSSWADPVGLLALESYFSSFPVNDFYVKVPRYRVINKSNDENNTYVFERLNQRNQSLTDYLKYFFGDEIYSLVSVDNPYNFTEYQRLNVLNENNESSYYRRVMNKPKAGTVATWVTLFATGFVGWPLAIGINQAADAISTCFTHWDTTGVSTKDYFGTLLEHRVSGYDWDNESIIYAPNEDSYTTFEAYKKYYKEHHSTSSSKIHKVSDWNESLQSNFWETAKQDTEASDKVITLTPTTNLNKYFYEVFEKNSAYTLVQVLMRDKLKNQWFETLTKKEQLPIEKDAFAQVYFIDQVAIPINLNSTLSKHDKVYMVWINDVKSETDSPSLIIKDTSKFETFLSDKRHIGFSASYYYPLVQYSIKTSLASLDWQSTPTRTLREVITAGGNWTIINDSEHNDAFINIIYKNSSEGSSSNIGGRVAFFRLEDAKHQTIASYMEMPDNIAKSLPRLFDRITRDDFNYLKQSTIMQGFYEDVDLSTDLVPAKTKEVSFNIKSAYYTKDGKRIYTIKQLKESGSYVYLRNFTYQKEDVGIIRTFDIRLSKYTIKHNSDGDIIELYEESLNQAYEVTFADNNSKTITINDNIINLTLTSELLQTIDGMTNGSFWNLYHSRADLPVLFSTAVAIEAQLTEYWNQAYLASKSCEYFLPEAWTQNANQVKNYFANQIYKVKNNTAELLSTFLPEVNIWKQNGSVILKKYKFSYDTGETGIKYANARYVLEDQEIANESPTAIIMNNYALRNAFKALYNVSDQEIIDKARKWNLEEIGNTTYYYSNVGGTKWNQLVQEQSGNNRYVSFDGWYLMALRWLQQHYMNWNFNEYEDAQQKHDAIWRKLYQEYGHILLETVFKSETATTSSDLLNEAKLYFKDRAQPERAYSITIIDAASLKNYNGSEIRVGDGIQVNALDYYNQYDNIYQSLTQYLFITDISYTLRDASNIALTVNTVKYADTIMKRLAKLIK